MTLKTSPSSQALSPSDAQSKSILVRAPNWIGDQVMAYPFFHYLRKAYPKAHIAVVCVDWVKDLMFRGLIDEIFVLPRAASDRWLDKLRALEAGAKELRSARKWDLAISLPNSISSAWLMYRAGARIRRGYSTEGRGPLLSQSLRWDANPGRHRAQAYLDLLPEGVRPAFEARGFWGIPPENELDPGIPGELRAFDFAREWPTKDLLEPLDEPYWVLAVGATAESRRWPLAYFTALAGKIAAEKGWKGVIVGSAKEAPLAAQLVKDSTLRLKDLTARGPVSGLSQIFRQAQFTVSNESGLAHVAALCGSMVQIVCGAADPRRTQPLGPGRVQVSVNPVDCWPCERNVCLQPADNKIACLKGISPDSVWQEIKSGLSRSNPESSAPKS